MRGSSYFPLFICPLYNRKTDAILKVSTGKEAEIPALGRAAWSGCGSEAARRSGPEALSVVSGGPIPSEMLEQEAQTFGLRERPLAAIGSPQHRQIRGFITFRWPTRRL